MKWIEEEFEHTKLGDKRLDKRLKKIEILIQKEV